MNQNIKQDLRVKIKWVMYRANMWSGRVQLYCLKERHQYLWLKFYNRLIFNISVDLYEKFNWLKREKKNRRLVFNSVLYYFKIIFDIFSSDYFYLILPGIETAILGEFSLFTVKERRRKKKTIHLRSSPYLTCRCR